ncbi:MAG: molybdate ABC transporter substrate-binding protein [Rhodobacteraceae bacterium]|nr:molybdate ABC transporter substrate-binding protein [Paracoccaceae bacterium]
MMHRCLAVIIAAFAVSSAGAETTQIAVAANFTDAAKAVAEAFKAETGHDAVLSFGSTGQLYTQISQAAPFDVFLAADRKRPAMAATEGFGVPDTEFTYAIGQLVLWSAETGQVTGKETLLDPKLTRIAIANPDAAPYGAAAVQAMQNLKVYDLLAPKIVEGSSITQTFQFVATGNAEIGFVAGAQLGERGGSAWIVDPSLYDPIRQDAVLLTHGADNPAAVAFLEFLKTPKAREIVESYGYAVEP